jgi:hypothetical protein
MTGSWTISPRKRTNKPFSVRGWVLAAAAIAALAAPGVARSAGSPPGIDVTATVNSALAQVNAVAPAAAAAAQPAVDQASAAVSAASELAAGAQTAAKSAANESAPAVPPPGPAAAGEPVGAVAPMLAAAGAPSAAPAPAAVQTTTAGPRHANAAKASPRRTSARPTAARPRGARRTYSPSVPWSGAVATTAALTAPPTPARLSSSARSSRGGRSSGAAPGGARQPAPLPEMPQGPLPDLTSPMQSGGVGSFAPLLVAALAAVLALASFPFSSRLLPQLAFRKPRRVLLAVWHPG